MIYNANALNTFLTANLSAMQSWVSNGGSLFINAAPNEGGNINFGFGVTLNWNNPATIIPQRDGGRPRQIRSSTAPSRPSAPTGLATNFRTLLSLAPG